MNYPTRFDCRETLAALKGLGRGVPQPQGLRLAHLGLLGASSRPRTVHRPHAQGHRGGQGRAGDRGLRALAWPRAHKFAEAGATTLICGRDQAKLDEACAEAKAKGYAFIAYPADIADMQDCDRFVQQLIADHGGVDFLINNAAARSAAPSSRATTDSTTTSAPCSSTILGACA